LQEYYNYEDNFDQLVDDFNDIYYFQQNQYCNIKSDSNLETENHEINNNKGNEWGKELAIDI